MKRGEIWLINFDPSIGKEYQKMRPALIIQSDTINSNLVTVIPFSSKLKSEDENDILVVRNQFNRLYSDSMLKVKQIASFDKRRFINFIGVLSASNMNKVKEYLKVHFDL